MKNLIFATVVSIIAAALFGFKTSGPKPKLFPEIEKYYAGISMSQPNTDHIAALRDLTAYIRQGMASDKKINLLFACTDNSFKSISAQIVLQSLLSVNKNSRLIVNSCGYQSQEINPALIKVLTKHGFVVTDQQAATNGKKSYDIKFGDDMPSLVVYSKENTDAAIPKSNFFLMKMCSDTETSCTDLAGASYKNNLPFESPDTNISEEEADKQFTMIASEIVFAFNRSK